LKLPFVPWVVIATAAVLTMAVALLRFEDVENATGLVLVSGLAASAGVGVLVITLTKH